MLRQIDEEVAVTNVWLKLKSLYITKSLTNRKYLKEQLFGSKINSSKFLDYNLDEFNKITVSLANIDEKISKKIKLLLS